MIDKLIRPLDRLSRIQKEYQRTVTGFSPNTTTDVQKICKMSQIVSQKFENTGWGKKKFTRLI